MSLGFLTPKSRLTGTEYVREWKSAVRRGNTNLKSAVPTSGTQSHSIGANTKAAHTVLVTREDTDTLTFERVPHIARPVVIAAKQHAA